MLRSLRLAPVALLLFSPAAAFALQAPAKSEANKPAAKKPADSNAAVPVDAEQQLKNRRSQARSLLIALSTDARTFHDQTLRARSLARIADALWTVDAEQGRALFRKAWEAAEGADQESDRKLQEEIERQRAATGGGFSIANPPSIRREVLRLAARHDRALGEELLDKLKAQKAEAANSANLLPGRLSDALNQRLDVARGLLQAGDMERALQFADPALTMVATDSINFLCDLREKDAAAADQRYAALLSSSSNNPQSDANTVSLLSSYIFTPHYFVIISGNGTSTQQSAQTIVPANVSPELRNAFFQTAASILLRPLPPPGQDQSTAGLDGKYLVLKRLLPFLEQSAPTEMVESFRAQLNALSPIVSDDTRKRDDEWLNRGSSEEKPAADVEQGLLDRIERAKTSAQRDSLYIDLAMRAASRGEMKAREYVGRIEDLEVRKQVQAYIDASLAMYAVQKKQTDQALDLVAKGELNHLQKVWVLSQSATILAPTDKDKAVELVEAAANEARRLEPSDPSRPQALIAVANAMKVVDASRVWDATFDAVKAANSAEGFTGEDGGMVLKFQTKGSSSVNRRNIPEFDVEGIFRDLADQDYERAVEMARGFEGEGPRAVATIAIARAILQQKKRG